MASIRKRTFGKNKDEEVWIVDYYDQHKKRHIKTFPNKKAAEAWKVGAQHEISQGTHTPASTSLTVAEVWAKWLKECEAELEFGTVRERRNHFKHHVAEFLGNVRLSSLTQPMVYEFDSALRNANRSWAMRRKVLTSLKTCLAFAQGRGYAAQNVARGVRIKKENREGGGPLRAGVDFPTMPELNTLIDNAQRRWRPFIVTAIFSGMRMSELRGLCWGNVDLDTATIHVRQRADGWNQIGPPKSDAGARDIPLPPLVVNTLRQ